MGSQGGTEMKIIVLICRAIRKKLLKLFLCLSMMVRGQSKGFSMEDSAGTNAELFVGGLNLRIKEGS